VTALLSRVVEHYHRIFCERKDAQAYLAKRGLTDADVLKAFKVGYADGSLLKTIPKDGDVKQELLSLGILTRESRELLGGCVVVPIPDPISGEWTTLYGRGMRTPRHCYLTGPLRGVLNFQAARSGDEVILTESVLDALSFHQVGVSNAIPIYGTNGFTADHLDLLKREGVRRVILALDGDAPGRRATTALKEKLASFGIAVRVMPYPPNVKDPNELLVSCNGNAQAVFAKMLNEAEPRTAPVVPARSEAARPQPEPREIAPSHSSTQTGPITREGDALTLHRNGLVYHVRVYAPLLGRLRATVKVERGSGFHVDSIDLYASRSRAEFGKRVAKALNVDAEAVERDLLALLVEAEKTTASEEGGGEASTSPAAMSETDRAEALAFLKRRDLLDQTAKDIDALGFVGEDTNKRLLYLVAISRKLPDPLSAIVLSQSGAGKSGLTEVIEKLTPPEDVVLLTRLTPQSLYYTEPGFLDQKLVIVEERYGSMEADYSIRVLQSRKKLIAAAPIKDPQTGNMRTKVFTVEARAAFIEATTASAVNHENATRCFELSMDESAEQTRRIHERMGLLRTERGLVLRQEASAIARRHWNAQRLLEPLPVVIPFADKLTFPSAWLRTRRDYARFLNLIEVSAFLHQHQREHRNDVLASQGQAIMADVADYAAAYTLAASVLAETLSDVRRPLREAHDRIRALCSEGDGTISRREIREALGVPDSTVRRWLTDLVELEYLAVIDAGRQGAGKTARYRLADSEPTAQTVVGLLTPAELRKLVA
jgi:5S rRNA maturation endonuclease (ribonuclease M5)